MLNFTQLLNITFLEQLLDLNLLHRIHIFMDYTEEEFLKNEQIQPWICFRYTDIFSSEQLVKKSLTSF